MSARAWDDLVATAVQGTARRQPEAASWLAELGPVAAELGGEPPQRLLDAAVLATVGRRAGTIPGSVPIEPGRPPVPPAPPEPGRVATGLVPWFERLAETAPQLMPQLLAEMRARGLVFPAAIVPEVLDLGVRDGALAPAAFAAAGARGAWLAGQDERWSRYAAHGAATAENRPGPDTPADITGSPDADDPAEHPAWREGAPATRIEWLATLLTDQPSAALELARTALTGRGESADLRERVIGVLATRLCSGTVELLEAALDDRALRVRRAAARALGAAADAPYQQRMAARAHAWVHLDQGPRRLMRGRNPVLTVMVPTHLDEQAERDQLDAEWHGQLRGTGARLVHGAVATAPLATWAPWGTPEQLVRMQVSDGWAPVLHHAWAQRAITERDSAWADALLSDAGTLATVEQLVSICSPAAREAALLHRLSSTTADPAITARQLAAVPHPWPARLLDALVAALPKLAQTPPHAWTATFHDLAAHEPPQIAQVLTPALLAITDPGRAHPDHPVATAWVTVLTRCLDTLELRSQLLTALDAADRSIPHPPGSPTNDSPPQGDSP